MKEPLHMFRWENRNNIWLIVAAAFVVFAGSCKRGEDKNAMFTVLRSGETGLDFTNKLTPSAAFNMFNYMYFYNGGGVGAGDFNNDGLIDLFFSSNQGANKLYVNKGNLKFSDVTESARIPQDGGWSTGVSVVDINNDGLLDIYICRVGKYEILNSRNQFLVCQGIKNGIPYYVDLAPQLGLDFSGFSTQALFFDYDMDGDNDMYLLNHSVHQNAAFGPRANFAGTYSVLSGDRIFRNEEITDTFTATHNALKFVDVTASTGINSSAIGYGLGVVATDINMDGYPDLYIGNDFHENDYLYINQRNGKFRDESNDRLMHTSKFSMGVDAADANNDGYPEIISMDMLPADPYILKRSLGDDEYDIFLDKIKAGYNYQYSRNALQFNRGNGMFSELALYSGIYATDWSWAPLWMDFDNDGLKDLFISNGIPKRLNDMDYINFVSGEEIQQRLNDNKIDETNLALVKKFPEIKIPNKFYKNGGNLAFNDIAGEISNDEPTYSNGAVYADLDNDGDLDIVVNNIDDPVLVYENNRNTFDANNFVEISLNGPARNRNAIGARVIVFNGNEMGTYENYPVRGFQSSMQVPLHIGLSNVKYDSAVLIWPDNTYQAISLKDSSRATFTYTGNLPQFNYNVVTSLRRNETRKVEEISGAVELRYKHSENPFIEFNREPLIPHMISTEGPAMAVADINNDGLQDVFLGSSKRDYNAIFIQNGNGKFVRTTQPAMMADSMYEDVDAAWADVNADGNMDLVVASGGNEYYGRDKYLQPRVYINDGNAQFRKMENAFGELYLTASTVVPCDINKDGFPDLFIGGRAVPWDYGSMPKSYLLFNDGTGKFTDVTEKTAPDLTRIGMVTGAAWLDIDSDKDTDLVVSCEWGTLVAFVNQGTTFKKKELTAHKGWWNFILPADLDNDGDMDLVAGNLGLNSRLKASAKEPVKLYYNDFDGNGKKEQLLTYFVNGKMLPFVNKDELQKQLPFIKKKFLYAKDFAQASAADIFGAGKLADAEVLTADYFSNVVFINNGDLNFTIRELPWEAQLSPFRDGVVINANNDNLPDLLLVGNYYDNNIQMGRYDADFGTVLVNRGKGVFSYENLNGVILKGQVRKIKPLTIAGQQTYLLAKNNDSTMVIRFN